MAHTFADMLKGLRRMPGWWGASIVALAVIVAIAPQQISVLVYKLAQVTIGVKVSYWADRALFRNAPGITSGMPRDTFSAARILARAVIAFAVIVGLTIGI